MRVPPIVSDFIEWRWAPCVGLTAGSLAFVALALLLIPTRFDGQPPVANVLNTFDSPRPQRSLYASSLAASRPEPAAREEQDARVASSPPVSERRSDETSAPPARGFSPVLDRPEPLAPAPAGDAPMPPPASGASVVAPSGHELRQDNP